MTEPFVHLHVHSDYSLLTGAAKIKNLVARAAELEMPALALTDNGNLFGAVEFYDAAVAAGIRPIVGMEAYLTRGSRHDKNTRTRELDHLVLLAADGAGFRNLIKVATAGYLEGFYYRPRVDYEFLEDHAAGLIAISVGMKGAIAKEMLSGQARSALELAGRYKEIFEGRFYVGLEDHDIPHQRSLLPGLVDTARRAGTPVVATNDVYYLDESDAAAQEILVNIRQQNTVADANRFRAETTQRYFKSPEEMQRLFGGIPESLRATAAIADRIEFSMSFGNLLLPDFPLPGDFDTPQRYLEHLAAEGLHGRYGGGDETLAERLAYELGIIEQMGYAGYFLIVRDFIQYSRDQGIAVGPGRGSAAGSLVAYCLGITDIDPVRFGLLFERFLNPERVSMPDIDIDFDYRRRAEVIEYVKRKYGADSVTQIITFGTMAARGVIRDVGRVLAMEYGDVDHTAKLVPAELGITLERAVEQVPELNEMSRSDGVHGTLLQTARVLEGLARHASTHAAGVLIAPGRLDDVVPLFKSGKGEISTQWDMKSSERVGLLKMDFLGLRTLTVIGDALDLIEERTGTRPDLDAVPLDDPGTFELLRSARTVAVFQLESAGMRDLLRKLAPEAFEDIVAVNALYRPGPMGSGMVNDFIDGKHGTKPIRYEHESLKPILEPTYGMMVYQEQVMQIASSMAGFSLGDADLLRRAMGKKKQSEMEAQRVRFVEGATARGYARGTAEKVFEQMAYFAGYGFNKSHSAAYALISYHTAYLKAHHPAEFMAATLTSEMDSTDRVMVLVEECRKMGIEVQKPCINRSRRMFTVTGEGIRFGLGAVKNVGAGVIDELVAERAENGPYAGVFDLCRRVNAQALNRRVVESLAAAGALDVVHESRARAFAAAPLALEAGSRSQRDAERGQTSLFAMEDGGTLKDPPLPDVARWGRRERLRHEKEVLGFYLSDHPLSSYRDEVEAVATGDIAHLKGAGDGAEVRLLAVIGGVLRKMDKKGRPMAFVTVEDFSGTMECVLFSKVYEASQAVLEEDRVVLLKGRLDRREADSDPKLMTEEVLDFESNRANLAHTLYLKMPVRGLEASRMEDLRGLLERFPGSGDVVLHLELETGRRVRVKLGSHRVGVHPDLLSGLRSLLGEDAVRLGEAANGRNGR